MTWTGGPAAKKSEINPEKGKLNGKPTRTYRYFQETGRQFFNA
jgi:hypothetical protein